MEKSDQDMLMDHTALEMMHAIDRKDHETFKNGFHAMVAHSVNEMSEDSEEGDE